MAGTLKNSPRTAGRERRGEEVSEVNNHRVRGHAMAPDRTEQIEQTAKKVAKLLAENKATFADVDIIFARSKHYIVSGLQ